MANLKSLLGDKYQEGMTIDDVLATEIEMPKLDTSGFVSKESFDKVASEAAEYKRQLRASMSDSEAKAAEEAQKLADMAAELEQLKADKAIAENAKGLVAIGYDEKLATEVAKALYEGDSAKVIQAQAQFVDAQKKSVLAEAVKETPAPPTSGDGGTATTKEQLRNMTPAERYEFSQKNPEEYKQIYGGN